MGATDLITAAVNSPGSTRRMGLIIAGIAMCGALGDLVTSWTT